MELKKVTDNVYYIPARTNIGVIDDGNGVILVDSGVDDNSAKKILEVLEQNDFRLKALINTHAHADHDGGNSYLQQETGAKIYATEMEEVVVRYPELEPLYLFSGAAPISDLENKSFFSKPADVDYIIRDDEKELRFDNLELEIIRLPGHSFNQIGIAVEGVLFCADTIVEKSLLDKLKLPYNVDIVETKRILGLLKESGYELYIPSHGPIFSDIEPVVEDNLEKIAGIEEEIYHILKDKKGTEEVIRSLCSSLNIQLKAIDQYYSLKTTVMAYLSALHQEGRISVMVEDNCLYWKRS